MFREWQLKAFWCQLGCQMLDASYIYGNRAPRTLLSLNLAS
jgi:hypothetical protein